MKTISKTLLILTAFSSPLLAGRADLIKTPPQNFSSGFNVAATLGYGFGKASMQNQISIPDPAAPYSTSPQGTDRCDAVVGGVSLGYQHSQDEWMVGGGLEVTGDAGTFRKNFETPLMGAGALAVRTNLSLKLNRGFAIEPMVVVGRKVDDKVMIFAGIGPSFGCFKGTSIFSVPGDVTTEGFKLNKTGIKGTLGAEVALTPEFSVAGSVSYTEYTVKKNLPGFGVARIANQINSLSFKVSYLTPAIKVSYRF